MHKFMISAAAIALATTLAAAPASAEQNYGPIRNGNQCWIGASNGHGGMGFGRWEQCPAPAAARGGELHHPLRPRRDPHNDR